MSVDLTALTDGAGGEFEDGSALQQLNAGWNLRRVEAIPTGNSGPDTDTGASRGATPPDMTLFQTQTFHTAN